MQAKVSTLFLDEQGRIEGGGAKGNRAPPPFPDFDEERKMKEKG